MEKVKKLAYRHGEILLVKIDKLPKGLSVSKSKIIMQGSHGNNHEINNGKIYFKKESDFVFGYLVAKNTSLIHSEHKEKNGKSCKIEDGIYQLIKQNEYTPSGLIPVID
jgi:hypothetical protein